MVVQGQHSGSINQVLKHATLKKTFASQKKKKKFHGKNRCTELYKNSKLIGKMK